MINLSLKNRAQGNKIKSSGGVRLKKMKEKTIKSVKGVISLKKKNVRLKLEEFKQAMYFSRKFFYNWMKIKTNHPAELDPIFALYLVTKRCNFRCTYCYAESNDRINSIAPDDLDFAQNVELLKIMRKDVSNLYFSGGEPLLRNDMVDILKTCRELNYHVLSLTTNGILLPKKPEIVDYLDYLAISLDTLDEAKNDKLSGVRAGTTARLIQIIKDFAAVQKEKGFTLLINAVIGEHNIPDIYDLMEFCFTHNIGISVIGQMENFHPIPYLRDNPEYIKLVDHILDCNRKGYPVLGMPQFNETMLLFRDHSCFPLLIPTVYPNGDLLYPCEVLNRRRYNLLETGSIREAYRRGQQDVGAKIECPGECYMPAFIMASCFMEQPFSAIKQGIKLKMGNCYNQHVTENKAKAIEQKAARSKQAV
jgi:MoaA/NifB/PqqE/SkfB family radical SAM enzyme